MAIGVFLMAFAACGQDPERAIPEGVNTPDIRSTITALALTQAQALTPTPVPASVRQELQNFAAGHDSTSDDWDRFHQGMDRWRDDVAACTPGAFESALDSFAGRALGIAQSARSLDRLPSLDVLAARLAAAAEDEAAAFQALSRNGLSDSAVSFEEVASVRSAVGLERAKVATSLLARQTVDGASLAAVASFATSMEQLDSDWDDFHQEYDAYKVELIELGSAVAANRLGGLVTQFDSIVEQVQDLPDTLLTREIASQLADAADAQQLLLRRLLGSIGGDGALIENVPVLPEEFDITGAQQGETGSEGLTLSSATISDVFDTQIAVINRLRRSLRDDLRDARSSLNQAGQVDLATFLEQVEPLGREWDDFHDRYDEWRRTNGGCNQGAALEALGRLAAQLSETVHDINNLPSVPLVREMGASLIQAVEREQAAVLSLRESWRSLDTSAFGRYTADRAFAENLRRQVALDLQDLLARQGL